MTPARRRPQPPPVANDNPPSPPVRQPPPEPESKSTVEQVVAEHESSLLASMLANGETPMADTARVISGLVNLRRRRPEPMTDYVADGTRIPRFIKDAIAHEAALTGLSCQEIMRDALLGVRPLSPELLNAHYFDLYGVERGAG